jgi:hypothetical protein
VNIDRRAELGEFCAPDDQDQALILSTAPEGSPSEAALQLLAARAQTVRVR